MSTLVKPPFVQLDDPQYPFPLDESTKLGAPPIYYWDDAEQTSFVFMIDEEGIIKYDLDQQRTTSQYIPPTMVRSAWTDPYGHLNKDKGLIYIHLLYSEWVLFNIHTKEWTYLGEANLDSHFRAAFMNMLYIPAPIDEMHAIAGNTHYKIATKQNGTKLAISKLSETLEMTHSANCIFNPISKQIWLFPEKSRNIMVCDINVRNQKSMKWKICCIKQPHKATYSKYFDVIIAWNQLLFYFDHAQDTIHCIDLLHSQQWIQIDFFKERVPDWMTLDYAVKDKHNNIHLLKVFECQEAVDPKYTSHIKVSLLDLIPMQIIKMNHEDMDPLVIGYCKQCEKDDKIPYLPLYLKKLILQFYPIFI